MTQNINTTSPSDNPEQPPQPCNKEVCEAYTNKTSEKSVRTIQNANDPLAIDTSSSAHHCCYHI